MRRVVLGIGLVLAVGASVPSAAGDAPPPAPNGISLPAGYEDWRLIAVSHRTDNESLRAILGNDVAIEAARNGQTNPWPNGAILAKIVMKDRADDNWPAATVPGRLVHVEFMIKDSERYAATLGWGFARWLGDAQTPYGEGPDFAQECVACHEPLTQRDYVFTTPVALP